MQADTIKPLADASNGEQSWAAYACASAAPTRDARPDSSEALETFPLKEN
jgi:hypothetical protein